MLASLALLSWGFWFTWMAVGLVYELFAVVTEKKTGALPLTRVVRDRIMRKSGAATVVVVTFLSWLLVHFTVH